MSPILNFLIYMVYISHTHKTHSPSLLLLWQVDLRPHKQNYCFTSTHSQDAHAAGGYLYLLFNVQLLI